MDDILFHSRGDTATTTLSATSKTAAPIKLSPADFQTFSGEIKDQDNHRMKAEAQIGQIAFKFLLSQDAANQDKKECDKELFNIFKNSFHE
eukprot:3492147-Ditylum_brightwellii.AAC.1